MKRLLVAFALLALFATIILANGGPPIPQGPHEMRYDGEPPGAWHPFEVDVNGDVQGWPTARPPPFGSGLDWVGLPPYGDGLGGYYGTYRNNHDWHVLVVFNADGTFVEYILDDMGNIQNTATGRWR